jgi:hypothetical protein
MPITLIDILKPKNNQPFPMVEDIDLLGGFRVVASTTSRDATGPKLKKHGMLCLVTDENIIYGWDVPSNSWVTTIDLNVIQNPAPTTGPVFVAECPSNAIVGDLVYPVPNWRSTVDFADIYNIDRLPAVGTIIQKVDPITCKVQTSGLVAGVYSGLLPGKKYWAGASHRPATTAPTAPLNGAVFHQPIGVALDPATLIFNPSITLTRIRG